MFFFQRFKLSTCLLHLSLELHQLLTLTANSGLVVSFCTGKITKQENDNIYPQGIKETYDMMLLDMLMYKCMYSSHIQQMYMCMYTHTHSNEM